MSGEAIFPLDPEGVATAEDISLTTFQPPVPVPSQPPVFPYAAILAIVLALFAIAVVVLLIVRMCMSKRGVHDPCGCARCSALTCTGGADVSCFEREGFREVLERMDCRTPDCRAWLDGICPTREQCALSCAMLCSCFCCHALADACQDVQLCPDCSAVQIPEMKCCPCCNFKINLDCESLRCCCFECEPPDNRQVPGT